MTDLFLCRICLVNNVTVYNILNTQLQEMYEQMTQVSLQAVGKPHTVCGHCKALLIKCHNLRETSTTADKILTNLISEQKGVTIDSLLKIDRCQYKLTHNLSIKSLEGIQSYPEAIPKNEPVKNEELDDDFVEADTDLYIPDILDDISENKQTNEQINDNVKSNVDTDTDSEDNMPLQTLSAKKSNSVKVISKDEEFLKGFKSGYATELILTKKEQLQELKDRATSINYLNSPFKCEFCYKGYIETRAYENHMLKHDVKSGAHACGVCCARYDSARALRAHRVTAHERRYQCNRCDHRAHTASQAREHEKWHRGHLYECQLCGHKFKKSTSYLTHMRVRHRTPHVCAQCGASFVGAHGLHMHRAKTRHTEQVVNAEEPVSERYCSACDIQFASSLAWKRHMLTSANHAFGKGNDGVCVICGPACPGDGKHLKEKIQALKPTTKAPALRTTTLTCEQCGSSFTHASKLQAHVKRVHLGVKYNKNVVCEVCGKKCTSNASLKYHQRTHTGEKPYACEVCPKRFVDSNQLRIHTRTHTGERPYRCLQCGKPFSQKPALNRHYRVHTGAKPYVCQYCSKTFSQSNSLKLHVNAIHLKLPSKRQKHVQEMYVEKKETIEKNVE